MESRGQSSRKVQKLSNTEQNMPIIDRLSVLPDSVLCHILSFLSTKLSVATSIVARRWRFLCAYVPNLHFEFGDKDDSTVFKTDTRFSDIIERVMLLHKLQNISTFHLHYFADDGSEYRFETWITTSVARNVQNLDLFHFRKVMLPRCLFTSRTLVDLRLDHCGGIPITGAICLPALKKLHLYHFVYESNESLPHLLSGCPVLEELVVGKIVVHQHLDCFYISSPTIKILDLHYLVREYPGSYSADYWIEINTPLLRYINIEDKLSKRIRAGALTSLNKAHVNFDTDHWQICPTVLEFVGRLSNIKCLKLGLPDITEILDSEIFGWTARFHNLTELHLVSDSRVLSKFLEIADNLEILDFSEVDEEGNDWMEPLQVPTCLLSHLKTITHGCCSGSLNEFGIWKYLLRNAQVLEKMELYSDYLEAVEKADLLQKLSLFERGSESCKVTFR